MFFRKISDDALAQYAYLIGCQRTGEAIVIDPERDVDRYVDLARSEGLKIVAAAETHIHADFLSGARELAHTLGVRLYLSDEGGADWRSKWAVDGDYDAEFLHDGDVFRVGKIEFRALHTPGHTPEHMSFVVTDVGGGADQPMGILSGDFVFVGDLGRPDLLESAAGVEGVMRPSAQALYASVPKFLTLPDFVQVWPAHGAGSACGKALGAVPASTVGYERQFSPALQAQALGEDWFVDWILEGQPEPPMYFARMKALNRDGVPLLGDLPRPEAMSAEEILDRAALGGVVVDTRIDRGAFMVAHVPGAIHAPFDKTLPTIVGSYVSPTADIFLVIDEADVESAVRALVRIGFDNIKGFVTARGLAAADGLSSIATTTFAELGESAGGDAVLLDVRGAAEFDATHITGALNIAHTRLDARLDEVPVGLPIRVHCRSGARAAAAASFLARRGYDVTLVDDTFANCRLEAAAGAPAGLIDTSQRPGPVAGSPGS